MTTAARYGWIVDVVGDVAACVTVVGGLAPASLMELFGADPDDPVDEDELEDAAAFHRLLGGGSVAVESNGYQGNRPEVLVPASRAAPNGRAASVYWNENVGIRFACAEAGRMVASMELPPYDDELGDLPPELRALVLPHLDDDVDPIALGAAMVHLFTGVGFGRYDVAWTNVVRINPAPASVEVDTVATTSLAQEHPELVAALAALPATTQRELVTWAVRLTLETAGLSRDADFTCVLDALDNTPPAPLPERARRRFGAIDRAVNEEMLKEHVDDWRRSDDDEDVEDDDEGWPASFTVIVSSETDDVSSSTHSVGPDDPEWEMIVRQLEQSPEFATSQRAAPPRFGDGGTASDDPEHDDQAYFFSEDRYRALNVQQWAAGTCEAALHRDAATSVWRTVQAALGAMDAVSRVDGQPHREHFGAEMVRRFLATHPSGAALLVPRPDAPDAARALAPALQRELVEWTATFLAQAAGVDRDPAFAATLARFGSGQRPVLMPATAARIAEIDAALEAERQRRIDDDPGPAQVVDQLVMLSTVAMAIENACSDDLARAAARAVGRAEMDLVHVALARQHDVEQSYWTTLAERFGITR